MESTTAATTTKMVIVQMTFMEEASSLAVLAEVECSPPLL